MPQLIFLNLPVADVKRSRAFYSGIGFGFDDRFCDEHSVCVAISETIFLMLLERERFAHFSPKPVADTSKTAAHLIALSRDSREAVDTIMEAALANGGADNMKVQEMGDFMYGRSFSDPDGHVFELMWMDVEKAMAAWGKTDSPA
jgi:uncharacterized protein